MTMSSHTEAGAAPQRGNPGEVLRLAREKKGWQVAEVATQLNLTVQSLAQLEAGEFDRLPGHTFARGYVRAYAKLLGLDQGVLVEQFDRFTGTDATGSGRAAAGASAPFCTSAAAWSSGSSSGWISVVPSALSTSMCFMPSEPRSLRRSGRSCHQK